LGFAKPGGHDRANTHTVPVVAALRLVPQVKSTPHKHSFGPREIAGKGGTPCTTGTIVLSA